MQESLIKISATAKTHCGYITLQLAEVAVPWRPFSEILRLIDGLRPKPAPT